MKVTIPRSLFLLSIFAALFANAAPAWSDHDRLRNEVRQFPTFLQEHPKVATELRNNPSLANSKKYLRKHGDLENFFKRPPSVKREVINHPQRVFGKYYREEHARWRHRNR